MDRQDGRRTEAFLNSSPSGGRTNTIRGHCRIDAAVNYSVSTYFIVCITFLTVCVFMGHLLPETETDFGITFKQLATYVVWLVCLTALSAQNLYHTKIVSNVSFGAGGNR